jgi:hypothetical protein
VHGQVDAADEGDAEPVHRMSDWFNLRVIAVLLSTSAATLTLAGTDVAITATMRGPTRSA